MQGHMNVKSRAV